jgi:hypothetical protein
VSLRQLLWLLAFLLLLAAAVVHYSPRLSRHTTPLALAGFGVFFLGWAVRGELSID